MGGPEYPTEEIRQHGLEQTFPTEETSYPTEESGHHSLRETRISSVGTIESGYPTEEIGYPTEEERRRVSSPWQRRLSRSFSISSRSEETGRDPIVHCNCLVEGIQFFPVQLRGKGLLAKLWNVLPVIELTVGDQVQRTRRVKDRQLARDPDVWKDETFVFKVNGSVVDLTVTCISDSGQSSMDIVLGAARLSLVVPKVQGLESTHELSLVRDSGNMGTPVLAGTLHLKTKFFSDKDKAGTSLDLAPLTPIISRLKPIKNAMRLALESPAIYTRSPSSSSLVTTSTHTAPISPCSPGDSQLTKGFCTSSPKRPSRASVDTLWRMLLPRMDCSCWWSTTVCLAFCAGVTAYLLLVIALPSPVSPPAATILPHGMSSNCLYGRLTPLVSSVHEVACDTSATPHEVMYRFIVNVLAFGS